ncbi:MAG: TRAP transporter large permease [Alphaproteobacteria bacterium]|nr:TRAP transporter large permease [Alphaproteobacteria bacterium]
MTPFEMGLLSLPVMLVLILMRVPIMLAMFAVGVVGQVMILGSWAPFMAQMKTITYSTFSSYSLSVIPMFLLMGQFASRGGLSRALFQAAKAFVGHRRGGLAQAAIAACGGFGAICGSSLATAATMGQVALPELRNHGYSDRLSTAVLAAGGTLGVLIPPSVVLVIYAILTEQNIAKLFMAAFIPGFLAILGYMVTIGLMVNYGGEKETPQPKTSWRERGAALITIWPVKAIFLLVYGGNYMGWFSATAGATGLYAYLKGELTWPAFQDAVLETASSTAMIFAILLGAALFNSFLAFSRVPFEAAAFVGALDVNPYLILTVILVVYLILGCFMDSLSMIILTIPVFFPVFQTLDFGMGPEEAALWFGVLVLIVVEVGLITPPVGLNLFVINKLAKDVPLAESFRGVLPFVASDLVRVVILTAFPGITLFAVHLLF